MKTEKLQPNLVKMRGPGSPLALWPVSPRASDRSKTGDPLKGLDLKPEVDLLRNTTGWPLKRQFGN